MLRQHAQHSARGSCQRRSMTHPQAATLHRFRQPRLWSHRRQEWQADNPRHVSRSQPTGRRTPHHQADIGVDRAQRRATAAVAAHARTSADVTSTTKSAASVAISTAGVRLARQVTYDSHAAAPAGIDHRSQRAGLDVVACAGARQHADPVPLRQRLAQRSNARACRALMRDLANAIPARPRCRPPNRCRHSTGRHRQGERLPRFGQERSRTARPPHRRGLPLPRRPRPCARHRGGIPRPRRARRRVRLRRREGS